MAIAESSGEQGGGIRRGRGGGGAEARRHLRNKPKLVQNPFISRRIPIYEVLSEEGLQIIEANADTILQEVGIEFRDEPEAIELWKQAGADVKAPASASPGPAAIDHPEVGAEGIHPARPQQGALGADRRRRHGVRAGLRPAVHPQPR
jgi:hypothetical protein